MCLLGRAVGVHGEEGDATGGCGGADGLGAANGNVSSLAGWSDPILPEDEWMRQ
jgi:hypothetical protein